MAPYRCPKNSSTASKYYASSPSPTFLQSGLPSSSQELLSGPLELGTFEDYVATALRGCGAGRAGGGVSLLKVVDPLPLWSVLCPGPGVGAEGVSVPFDGSWIEPWLLSVGLADGST